MSREYINKKEYEELFDALLRGIRDDIREKLLAYVLDNEYAFCHEGGEPDMEHILAVKLLECMGIGRRTTSIIYSDRYLEHVKIKGKGDVKG